MAAKVKTDLSSSGMRALLQSDGVREGALRPVASQVLSTAKSGAPRVTGAYADGLTIFDATTDRAVVRVGSTVEYADVVEAKTGNLLRALG